MTVVNLHEVYIPNKMQEILHASDATFICAWGGADSGKSWWAIVEGLMLSYDFPDNEGIVLRYSYRELQDYSIKKYIEFAQKLGIFLDYRVKDDELWIKTVDPNVKSIIKFRSIKESGARQEQSSKFGSTEIGWFHIEEGQDPRIKETVWHMLIKRLRRGNVSFKRGMITCNPPTPDHWIYRIFWPLKEKENMREGDYQLYLTTTYDNLEQKTGKPLYDAENLKRMLASFSPAWQDVYIKGKPAYIPVGRPIWTNFDWNVHHGTFLAEPNRKIIRIWDFGRRRSCVLFAQIARVRNENIKGLEMIRPPLDRVTFLREQVFEGKTTYRMADEIIAYSNVEFLNFDFEDIGDIAGKQKKAESEKSSFDILKEKGISVKGKAVQGLREKCIETIEEKLGQRYSGMGLIQIDEHCTVLADALAGQWTRDDLGEPSEDNYYEHPADCFIYLVANYLMTNQKPVVPIKIRVPTYGTSGMKKEEIKVVS